ncbi:hypothetical protein RvY_02769 [Ramazzottius varieornatus]|uniref:LysM domain-containing protein n=1 Tax=Ramazzottius varieornatus TaxID=947166 RepID=A0A1D1UPA2_RAMVA|nr:hypothetical protein RvY_02769 [Ramazzottius varieornatus]
MAAFNVNLETLEVFKEVRSLITTSRNRKAFVQSALHKVYCDKEVQGKYNVLVVNLQKIPQWTNGKPEGWKAYEDFTYDEIIFGIYVFESGEFHYYGRNGKGSPKNLAFQGKIAECSPEGKKPKTIKFILPDEAKFHTVIPGDTLWALAELYKGHNIRPEEASVHVSTWTVVGRIEEMNAGKIKESNTIFPGDKLQVRM